MSFEVAMKALLADADRWGATGDALSGASHSAAALHLPDQAFSFAGGDAAAAYESLRSFVQDYLSDGAGKAHGAARALRHVHHVYAGSDEAARSALEQKWKAL
ncbi:MAG: hypothetical protein ACXVEJ_09155 [Nocardioides sp.]